MMNMYFLLGVCNLDTGSVKYCPWRYYPMDPYLPHNLLVLLSQRVSWLALQVGSGVIDSDAGQDTGSRCSLMGGTAEASEWMQSGLGRFWPPAGKGLFQWENSMATWPPRSIPAEAAQSEQRDDKKQKIQVTSLKEKCGFSISTIFKFIVLSDEKLKTTKVIYLLSYMTRITENSSN